VVMRQRLEVRLHDLLLLKLRLVIKALVGNGKTLKLVAFEDTVRSLVVVGLERRLDFELRSFYYFTARFRSTF